MLGSRNQLWVALHWERRGCECIQVSKLSDDTGKNETITLAASQSGTRLKNRGMKSQFDDAASRQMS